MATKKSKARKETLATELEALFDEYNKLFVVGVDNVASNQMHEIRKAMRGTAVIYCGKNTQMRRVLRILEERGRPELEKVRQSCKLNVALIFTNENLVEVRDMILNNKRPSPARAGSVAQCEVTIPKGLTGLEPSMTQFLQALNISSKITKGNIEIINDVHLLKEGDKVDDSQAALLQKMDIMPFRYGLIPIWVYDQGSLFAPEILDIKDDQILAVFNSCLRQTVAVSVEFAMPTVASVPYSILLGFTELLAFTVETEYSFKEAEDVKGFLADPSMFASTAPAANVSATVGKAPSAAVKAEESDEEAGPAGGGLFAEADDY